MYWDDEWWWSFYIYIVRWKQRFNIILYTNVYRGRVAGNTVSVLIRNFECEL